MQREAGIMERNMQSQSTLAEDVREIRDLAYRYAQAVDRRDSEALGQVFIEDGVIEGSGYLSEGRDRIMAIPPMMAKRYRATFHAVQNHLVEVSGDRATGEVYTMAHHLQQADDGSLTDLVMIMRYYDDYVRSPDGWRFARRKLNIDWTELRPAKAHVVPRGG